MTAADMLAGVGAIALSLALNPLLRQIRRLCRWFVSDARQLERLQRRASKPFSSRPILGKPTPPPTIKE
jgi:hypothetical protein